MKRLVIGVSNYMPEDFSLLAESLDEQFNRHLHPLEQVELTDVGAAIITSADIKAGLHKAISETGYGIPVFLVTDATPVSAEDYVWLTGVIDLERQSIEYYSRQINEAVTKYECRLLPPFFKQLTHYVEMGNSAFDCPGHQGGQFFKKHPAGKQFYDFFGENLFRSDLCNADVDLGDLLIHEGSAHQAQAHAAKVFNSDKTYFVLNGTSASNKVVCNALVTEGDLVMFDRNNHKSNHHGALIQAGGTPVYLETARNPWGFIGGMDEHCFDEEYIRAQIAKVSPERARDARPFRLAIIQLGTYDGTIYNARYVMDKIGHLCDYILFDSAWVGYEQFIPMMKDCSPLLLDLKPEDAGVIVTQSVHKQQAGFSQTSQIHKKDHHIKGQARYCNHKRFNNAFMMHASTSPFYALFSALDVNAKIHDGEAGLRLWRDAVKTGIEARKEILKSCELIRPFIPDQVDGQPWGSYDTDVIATNKKFFMFEPNASWHKFEGYGEGQYFVDPCKLLLTTAGIAEDGSYADFGIPATLLANFLRENGIIPEKCDLNSILFLLTPAEDMGKIRHLVAQINRFEKFIRDDAPLNIVLPRVYEANKERYRGYTIRQLCQEMHDMYKELNVKQLQKAMFRSEYFPTMVHKPDVATRKYFRGECDYLPLKEAVGRVAAEGALPYPPGIICVITGEIWTQQVVDYFLSLEEGINRFPGFAPEIQGVYLEDVNGRTTAHCYALKD
ncbi:ornithine decarboxylase SpeF [Vibrio vulnificus]|uniref:ornithine decarboxylase SpeF n=1 Tax=Vibrio vulnificus TaxID=672 RepID=UPI0009B612DA|nr:ornithine decarboxylase SpeF [Vibrio vulnificus]EGR1892224.1 ornithine decarboxylase SpeF [Vibrio vulnificus]EHS1182110.1 ornithine decarboxylase SpeF [Vibrio vulnificus]EJA3102459.1 ornithine decarboxylase SpeF [Vibrio vulnificus]EJU9866685.1 ornithine decarboxylase SpeF [Vibrio vulnificus]ELL0557814.1 ornithine decarboxylase SpeF [Vibrio vulnificus]